jgi:putative membrane protein
MLQLNAEDHKKVSEAIAAAELHSDGEIIAVATPLSDSYHDVALHWAVLALFAVLAFAAAFPGWLDWWLDLILGGWRPEPSVREALTFVMILAVLKFTAVLLLLKYMPLRLFLTPGATKTRRVRRRAISIFKAGAERRTVGRTGVLL